MMWIQTMKRKRTAKLRVKILWLGSEALPHAAYVGSSMQQKMQRTTEEELVHGYRTLKDIKRLHPVVNFF